MDIQRQKRQINARILAELFTVEMCVFMRACTLPKFQEAGFYHSRLETRSVLVPTAQFFFLRRVSAEFKTCFILLFFVSLAMRSSKEIRAYAAGGPYE